MQLDPKTRTLYTDSGQFLKVLGCPENKIWAELQSATNNSRACDTCLRNVYDTSTLSDDQIMMLIANDPDTCLAVSQTQGNCTVVPLALQGKRNDIAR